MDNSITMVDEFMHISLRMRIIVLQSATGGMPLTSMCFCLAGSASLP